MDSYTIFKNTDGDIKFIVNSNGSRIPICNANADYQQYLSDVKVHGPYQEEIIPDPIAPRNLAAEIDAIKPILDDLLLGGV